MPLQNVQVDIKIIYHFGKWLRRWWWYWHKTRRLHSFKYYICIFLLWNSISNFDKKRKNSRAHFKIEIHWKPLKIVLWDKNWSTEEWNFLLVDANNTFNENNWVGMLWTVWHLWTSGARFVFNCYCHWSLLVLRNGNGTDSILHSR